MDTLPRRRFLSLSAMMAGGVMLGLPARAMAVTRWHGQALGAEASIALAHPDAAAIITRARAEIARLEQIFSLYRSDSVLVALNASGRFDAPPFELLECLGLCGAVHRASGGMFDPTVQPLWQAYAESYALGRAPDQIAVAQALARVGWNQVQFDAAGVRFAKSGMALTLNGVAQGYIADRVAALLESEGLTNILVNTGEFRALGGAPDGSDWQVALKAGDRLLPGALALRDRALASSAPRGTVFDALGRVGHILNPLTGAATTAPWQLVSVTAPQAGLADALSTAICLMPKARIATLMQQFPAASLVHLS